MEDIVKRLRTQVTNRSQVAYDAAEEIESLRAQLAEVTRERDEWRDSAINGGNAAYLREQLLATQANAARLVEALWNIAYGNQAPAVDVHTAKNALSTPINLDALHEDRARSIEDAYLEAFNLYPKDPIAAVRHITSAVAAHRAKKEGK